MKNLTAISVSFIENMKEQNNKFKIKLLTLVLLITVLFTYSPTQAQISFNVNISSQSLWGPVGYDYVEYYYMPQIGVYYSVPTAQFVYLSGSNWIFATSLPASYNVNLYNTYKVIINEPTPYLQNNVYVTKYAKYKNGGPRQVIIRDSKEAKYYVVKDHPKHGQQGGNNHNNQNNNHNNNNQNNNHSQNNNNNNQNKQVQNGKQSEGNKQNQPAKSENKNSGHKNGH